MNTTITRTALVTGGAGFLGTHLVEKLIEENFFVIIIDNFSTAWPENEVFLKKLSSNIQLIKADVTSDWSIWLPQISIDFLKNLKYVFHFASPASPVMFAEKSLEILKVNSLGLENALAFSDSWKARLIFASTSEVYGDPQVFPQPESYWGNVNSFGPRSCYDEAKRFGEALVYNWNNRYKTAHGLVRIFNTYGPRMNPNDGRVVNNFLLQALNNLPLTINGEGKQTRCFCYVKDLIDGIYKYSQQDITVPLNIGNPHEISVLQLAEIVRSIFTDKKIEIVFKNLPENDPQRRCPDITKALNLLHPWQPKTSLQEGLLQTAQWLRQANTIIRKP